LGGSITSQWKISTEWPAVPQRSVRALQPPHTVWRFWPDKGFGPGSCGASAEFSEEFLTSATICPYLAVGMATCASDRPLGLPLTTPAARGPIRPVGAAKSDGKARVAAHARHVALTGRTWAEHTTPTESAATRAQSGTVGETIGGRLLPATQPPATAGLEWKGELMIACR
jgi:hypothetical protein